MLQLRIMAFLIGILLAATLLASGFIIQRANNIIAALDIPANWNIAPSLEAEEKAENIKVTVMETSQSPVDGKNSSIEESKKYETQAHPHVTVNDSSQIDFAIKAKRDATSDAAPKNVVLVLIDKMDKKEGKTLKNNLRPFEVEEQLHDCDRYMLYPGDTWMLGFPLYARDPHCYCSKSLRAAVLSLLMWARGGRKMVTGTVLSSNFTLPSLLRLDANFTRPSLIRLYSMPLNVRAHDESKKSRKTLRISKIGRKIPYLNRVDLRSRDDNGLIVNSTMSIEDELRHLEGMFWPEDDFFNLDFALRSPELPAAKRYLELYDSYDPRMSYPFSTNLREHVANKLKELESAKNENGYMMVVAAPEDEAVEAIDLLRLKITEEDTLLVVMEVCKNDGKLKALYAEGPSSNKFRRMGQDSRKMVWGVPLTIVNAIMKNCQVTRCSKYPRNVSNRRLVVEVHQNPVFDTKVADEFVHKPVILHPVMLPIWLLRIRLTLKK